MDIARLLRDHGIPYVTEGHQHATEGWVNVHCPFCAGPQNFHLGIGPTGGCHCWRCGGHSLRETLSRLLGVSERHAGALLSRYGGRTVRVRRDLPDAKVSINPFRFPRPHGPVKGPYRRYLERRGFDAEKISTEWGLMQTGPISYLDGIAYSHRLLIPVHWQGEVVSFQARDITGKAQLKYLACPKKREKKHHKDILYVHPDGPTGRTGIIVEGVVDAWRLGREAAATFGIEFKLSQVLRLAEMFDRMFILFDREPQAQKQARALAARLRPLGKEVYVEKITTGDPGDMTQDDANALVRHLLGRN